MEVRSYLLHDAHFVVPDSEAIQIAGNSHLTRAQLLSVFGEDVDRNIFTIPLDARRAELESLPWVEHATVMRLLPSRVRVAMWSALRWLLCARATRSGWWTRMGCCSICRVRRRKTQTDGESPARLRITVSRANGNYER